MTKEEFFNKHKDLNHTKNNNCFSFSETMDKLCDEYISSNAKYSIGDKVSYNHEKIPYTPKIKKIGYIKGIWAITAPSNFGTIVYRISECFKNGKEKNMSSGWNNVEECDIIEIL